MQHVILSIQSDDEIAFPGSECWSKTTFVHNIFEFSQLQASLLIIGDLCRMKVNNRFYIYWKSGDLNAFCKRYDATTPTICIFYFIACFLVSHKLNWADNSRWLIDGSIQPKRIVIHAEINSTQASSSTATTTFKRCRFILSENCETKSRCCRWRSWQSDVPHDQK